MEWLYRILISLMPKIGRRSRPQDIPKKLDAAALDSALREARYLHGKHEVDVTAMKRGEEPTPPQPADPTRIPN